MAYSQDNRLIAVDTPLGKDVLLLAGFRGTDAISRLFSFELDMISENHGIAFEDIVGRNVTVSIVLPSGEKRYFNGIISRFAQGRGGGEQGGDPRFSSYRATLVPWLWLLTRTSDSRIFQFLSVPDIVEKILKENSLADYRINLRGRYEKRDYCVQYRETDFDFISRLMEEEGIQYFFEHENGKHTLMIADSPQENRPCPEQRSARYQLSGEGWTEEDVITALEKAQEIRPAKYTLNDFNFEIPNTDLKVNVPGRDRLGPQEREIYDYPGRYARWNEGDRLVRIRMEEEEARITTISGESSCRAFSSGYRFTLTSFYRSDMNNREYLLTSVEHRASEAWEGSSGLTYANRFTCIPIDVPFRPSQLTPKPFVRGSQTAIVVGPAGEEIHTDEYGRVKVQFHWDREGNRDDRSSCWIRVGQVWAGAGWGAMYIPRIGHEVIVDFLEGDPDRPIITGRVYHGMNMPPYPLPEEKTKSTIKSNSSMGGGGFNEFRFEDKKGREEIYLHGQKNWTISILNDKNQTIGHDETLKVAKDRTKKVGENQSETVGINKEIAVGANHSETIGALMDLTVGASKTETVSINSTETVGAMKILTVGGVFQISVGAAMNETIGGAKGEEIVGAKVVAVGGVSSENVGGVKSVNAGGSISHVSGGAISETASGNVSVTAGANFIVNAGGSGVINAGSQLTLKCGGASITLKKSGDIIIKGSNITIRGSGKIGVKAGGAVTVKGSKISNN
jgi:type VI secretion system secreted protein VgrG